jgi:hypothetical protein
MKPLGYGRFSGAGASKIDTNFDTKPSWRPSRAKPLFLVTKIDVVGWEPLF